MKRTVKKSTYGPELITSRIATEKIFDHCYCLYMMEIPVENPTFVIGDKKCVKLSA